MSESHFVAGLFPPAVSFPFLQELYRKVRSILNKLTPQKFQTLIQQINELDIDTADRLEGAIDLIFEKVCHCVVSM